MKKIISFKILAALCLAILLGAGAASAAPWKFGVMSDTQWSNAADAANNPGTVAVGIINQLNQQFINEGVKFVLQVGDLDDQETNYSGLPSSPRLGISTRAAAAQALYDASIGFFPLRGNHEGSATAAGEVQSFFPQTRGQGGNIAGATNFSSPSANLNGLSYSFDYDNTRFMLLDQFTPTDGKASDGTTYNVGNNAIASQQIWINTSLANKPSGGHAFVFSHKQLFGGNHTDTLFNTAAGNAAKQNEFISSLDVNNVGYLFSGHDHMHNRSMVTSPDGASRTNQIICASDSYKFYTPVALANHGTDAAGTGYPNAGLISKNRELEISQELWSTGYYIVTIDGPRATVDFYSADPTPQTPGLADVDLMTTPTLTFHKAETFGYSLNGKEVLVPQGGSYLLADNTDKAVANGETGYLSTIASILSGTNDSAVRDYNNRPLTKAVNTGWAAKTADTASDIFSLWGMTDISADHTDTFVLSMNYDPTGLDATVLNSGAFGLAVKDENRGWVNAISKNIGGATNFVVGEWDPSYTLGTYGVDTLHNTSWAVINHNSDFAVASMNAANTAPVVAISAPTANAVFDAPAAITITADASDDGTVAKVEFFSGAVKIGEDTTAPFSMTWNGINTGNYTLSAVATDNEGMKAPSVPVSITVNNLNNVPPTVALTAPVDGASAFAGSTIALTATAADTDGFVTKVEFYNGAVKIGEDTTAPYTFNATSVTIGSYAFSAVAIDNDGGVKTSLTVNISVVAVPSGGTVNYVQNFNSMGTTGTTPPSGWSIKNGNSGTSNSTWSASIPANGANSVATMVNAPGNLTATTTPASTNNNGYNAAAAGVTSDRMIATSPTSVAGGAIQLQLTNSSGGYMDRLKIGYDIYRINAPASLNELQGYWLFYSVDNGTTWTNVAPLNPTVSGPNGVVVPNTIGVANVAPTPVALSANWNPGSSILFRWVDDNGVPTSPDQMYGLDNVSVANTVSLQMGATTSGFVYSRANRTYSGTMTLTNNSQATISGQIYVTLAGLAPGVTLINASGNDNVSPYIAQDLTQALNPGASITVPLSFNNPSNAKINFTPLTYQ